MLNPKVIKINCLHLQNPEFPNPVTGHYTRPVEFIPQVHAVLFKKTF
jgi:hypothetical protein